MSAGLDPSLQVHKTFVAEGDVEGIAERIANPRHRRGGLICAVPDHPLIRAALARVVPEADLRRDLVRRARHVQGVVAVRDRLVRHDQPARPLHRGHDGRQV